MKRSSEKKTQFRRGGWERGRREDQQKHEAEMRGLCSKGQRGPGLLGRESAGQVTNGHELRYHRAVS